MSTQDALAWELYGNSLRVWLTALGVSVGAAIALMAGRSLAARRLDALSRRTATQFDDVLVDLLRRTRIYFIIAIALAAGSLVLVLPGNVRRIVQIAAVLALLLQVSVWGNGLISFMLESYAARKAATEGTSATTIAAFGVLARVLLWLVILLLALDNLGVNITTLVTGLGITGIAVALAVQNILGDLFGALSIVLDKPFVVGDTIAVDNFVGTIEHIGLKTTRVRSLSGEQVIFSNADLLKSRIRNFRRQEERRVVLTIGVTYDTPRALVEQIPGIIRAAIEEHERTRFDRSHFRGFGPSSLDFETVYFVTVPDYTVHMDIQQAINLRLLDRFHELGVEFAFPTQTVMVRSEDGQRMAPPAPPAPPPAPSPEPSRGGA